MSSRRKPSDRLTTDDFSRIAVWTYDSARRDDAFDEPWVRPARADDALDDEIFVRATLTDRDGKAVPRSVLALRPGPRKGAKPVATALVVLSPFSSNPIEGEALAPTASAAILRLLPIRWEVDVKVGTQRLRADGRITERPTLTMSTQGAEEATRRQALIEAALQKRNAEMAREAAIAAKAAAAKPAAKKAPAAKPKKPAKGGKKKR